MSVELIFLKNKNKLCDSFKIFLSLIINWTFTKFQTRIPEMKIESFLGKIETQKIFESHTKNFTQGVVNQNL